MTPTTGVAGTGDGGRPAMSEVLQSLLRASHLMAPDDLAAVVAAHARMLGAEETVLYLADYEQATLLPLPGAGVPERQELPIERTMAGRAFRRVELLGSPGENGYRLWAPLLDGVERLGVAELVLPDEPGGDHPDQLRAFITLVTEMIVVNDAYSDVFSRLRRRKTLSLAAEMQWELLPPLSFGTDRVVITGGLEPAYDIGGDSFDYAINGSMVDLVVIDSIGHGLSAAVLATVAIGAYRHARRNDLDLPDIAVAIDSAIAGQFAASQFATAVLARLDVDTGRLRWVNAGHPEPIIVRGSSLVQPPHCPPAHSACRTANPSAARPAWSPATVSCSTPTASPRPVPRTGSSSASTGSPTSSAPPSQPATPHPRRSGA